MFSIKQAYFFFFFRNRGELEKWNQIVVPGIRRCIVGAMLACQEGMSDRRNSFNLYGADFLLTEEFTPLLIEINSCPCMRNTTDVTSKMCPMVLDDTIQGKEKKSICLIEY